MCFYKCFLQNEVFDPQNCQTSSFLSVGVLLASIISGRFGLWLSDITITQVLQEKVLEEHRGVIGGVQNALNSSMDTIKFIFVIVLPRDETFGWLILASVIFVSLGAFSFIYYAVFEHDQMKSDMNKNTKHKDEYKALSTEETDT